MFFPLEESTRSIKCCFFDGTKSNYLFDQVNKWFVLEDLQSRLEIKEDRRSFSNFNHTLDMNSSRRDPFSVFFSESKELFLSFSFSRSFENSSIFLIWLSCLVRDVLHILRCKSFSLGCISQTVCLHKMEAQTGGPI